jgi:divalent metal cation (Fe/Co/Zn/Cd) transporter
MPELPVADPVRRAALWLSFFTVGYNLLEGGVSLLAGAWADSIALTGFGLDSFMESLSGGVMIWRFGFHPGLSEEAEERVEHRAVRLVGGTFFLLGGYILIESVAKLIQREAPKPSSLGIAIALVSLGIMPVLFLLKRRAARRLGSSSLMADSKQTLACMVLSGALLLGLGANALFGLWQADPLVGLGVALYLFREGWETFKEKRICAC